MFEHKETEKNNASTMNFYLEYEIDYLAASSTWKVSRRAKQQGFKVPLGEPIGEITYLCKDEYATCSQIINFSEALTDAEYKEILDFTNEMQFALDVYFISVLNVTTPDNSIYIAFKDSGYETDPVDSKLVLMRKTRSILFQAPIVGVALGAIYGKLTHQNMVWACAIFMILGALVGVVHEFFRNKKKDDMLRKRNDRM